MSIQIIASGRKALYFALICLVSVPCQALGGDNPFKPVLPFKTAIIHYDASGTEKGTETLYARGSGEEIVRVTKTSGKVMFVPTSTNSVQIINPDWIITVDMNKKTGEKITNPQKYYLEEYNKLSAKDKAVVRKNLKEIGLNIAKQLGGSVKHNATDFLGFKCDVVTMMGVTSYQISNTPVVLKIVGSVMGLKVNTVATKIEKNVAVPDEMFKVPDGVEISHNVETDNMSKTMAVSMIERLKDPDAPNKQNRMIDDMKKAMKQEESEREAEQDANDEQEEQSAENEDEGGMQDIVNKGLGAIKGIFGD